jgi:hypothetical protein
VVIHFDVFGTGMEHKIRGEREGAKIINPHTGRIEERDLELLKQHPKLVHLNNSKGHGVIFSFRARFCNHRLLLGSPRDKTWAKINPITSRGLSVIRAPRPIRVTVPIELQ